MNRKILLLEPNYKNKYPPMGLMKLATYFREYCNDDVQFYKGDLKTLAAKILCDEYFQEIKNQPLKIHYNKFVQCIKTNKLTVLDSVPNFKGTILEDKIKAYCKRYNASDFPKFDIIAVTTLFTFYWDITINTINYSKRFLKKDGKLIVGGIAASILSKEFYEATGVIPHKGLLNKKNDIDNGCNVIIDTLPLDYSILSEIEYQYPAQNAYYAYMTRGCTNKCSFCAVPRLEPKYQAYISLKKQLGSVIKRFGEQKDLLLLDNNVFASKDFDKIIDEIKMCGFEKGATFITPNEYDITINNIKNKFNIKAHINKMLGLYNNLAEKLDDEDAGFFYLEREARGLLYIATATVDSIINFDSIVGPLYNKKNRRILRSRYVDFNQGIDARLVTDKKMMKLAEINIKPLRIAFDHYSMKNIYIKAVKLAAKYDIKCLSNYLLYNYKDKPEDLYYRMKINIELCEELGVEIYSFPMKYHPIDNPEYFHNRNYIGINWNRKFIRSVQAVLNATKGKIGRGKEFFEEAFGRDIDEFIKILWMPETFIIYRRKYDAKLRNRLSDRYKTHYKDENNLVAEWWSKFSSLNNDQMLALKEIIANNVFTEEILNNCKDRKILNVLKYYMIKRNDV